MDGSEDLSNDEKEKDEDEFELKRRNDNCLDSSDDEGYESGEDHHDNKYEQ